MLISSRLWRRLRNPSLDKVALKSTRKLQRQAQWTVHFINAENSMGFHALREGARIFGEAIDFAR